MLELTNIPLIDLIYGTLKLLTAVTIGVPLFVIGIVFVCAIIGSVTNPDGN